MTLATFAGSLGVLTFAAPATAQEGELPVAVLTIQTLDAFEQADALTNTLKRAVEDAEGYSYAQLDKDHALLFLISSLGCNDPPDAACEQKIGDELKVDRFVWGTMKKEGNDVLGDLHLWTRGQGGKSTTYRIPVNVVVPSDPDFAKLVLGKFGEMTGPPPAAKLRVKANIPTGTIFIDGKEAGKLAGGSATFDLPRGSHRIKIVAEGYEDAETTIDLKAREERDVSLTSVKKSGGPDIKKILGFTSIGVGVAAAGVATYATVRVASMQSDLDPVLSGQNLGPNIEGKDQNACDNPNFFYRDSGDSQLTEAEIQDICSESATMGPLNAAMWPVAGVFVGTGIILLAVSDWGGGDQEAASLPFLVVPSIGPEGGGASFSMRF